MGVLDIVLLLGVTIGPTKAAAVYLSLTAGATPELKRRIAVRAVATATVVCAAFAVFGQALLDLFHVGVPAMLIAGGIILFVFALDLVLGEEHAAPAPGAAHALSPDVASYPLAVPLMASPQGLVAIVALAAAAPGWGFRLQMLGLVLLQMAFNLVFLLSADKIFRRVSPAVLKVVVRVFGLLLCGLAVQLAIIGLQRLGVLPAGTGH